MASEEWISPSGISWEVRRLPDVPDFTTLFLRCPKGGMVVQQGVGTGSRDFRVFKALPGDRQNPTQVGPLQAVGMERAAKWAERYARGELGWNELWALAQVVGEE